MIEEQIVERVSAHYSKAREGVLLLSQLGKQLADDKLWPPINDNRTLTEIVEGTDGLSLVRDEDAKAYIAIVLAGDEERAKVAIEERHKRSFLRDISRALLAAFTIHVKPDENVYVHFQPKLRFSVSAEKLQDGILIDTALRIPDLEASDVRHLSLQDVARLALNIRAWCDQNDVEYNAISWRHERTEVAVTRESSPASSALERLYMAQDVSVAKSLVIPFDIALELSRMK